MDPLSQQFERFRAHGDLPALAAVFDALAPRLLPVAMHLTGRPADAEDALQQTFLLAMDKAATFDPTRRLEPWLAGLLQNVVRNQQRTAGRRRTEPLPECASDELGPLALAEREELIARLRTHVDALPSEQRQVVRLQLQHGLSPAQIAEALDLPPGTVRMRLHRGLEALRRWLPAGLAALLATALPAQGLTAEQALAAVKDFVLAAAQERLVAAAATAATSAATATSTAGGPVALFGGLMAMKKVLLGVLAAAVLGACWWFVVAAPAATPPPVAADGAQPSRPEVASEGARDKADLPVPAAREVAAAAAAATKGDEPEPTPTELWGRVVDAATAQPIADAAVELLHRPADEFWNLDLQYGEQVAALARVRTGADGTFRFDVERARPHRLRVTAGGYATTTVLQRTGGSVVVVALARGALLHGVVRASGKPLVDAEVRVAVRGEDLELGLGRTDGGGAFRFSDLPAARVFVQVRSRDFEEAWRDLELVAGRQHDVTVELAAGQALVGKVVDDTTGIPIVEAEVSDSWVGRRVVRSDGEGRFRLAGLRDQGFLMLHVHAQGYASWSQNVAGTLADERVVRLRRGGEVTGRLVDAAGTAIVDAYVAVASEVEEAPGMRGNDWLRAPVGPDGRFLALGLRPELHYSLLVRSPGRGARVYLLPRPLASGERHDVGDVVLRAAGGIEGVVVDERGEPWASASVSVRGSNADVQAWAAAAKAEPPTQFLDRGVLCDSRGRFRIHGLAAGRFALSARMSGREEGESKRVAVVDGQIREEVRLVLVRGLSLRGVVRRADGVPLDAAQIDELWLQVGEAIGETRDARIEASGAFSVLGLRAGTCTVSALRAPKGWSLAPQRVEAGAEDVQLVLEPCSHVAGQVVDGDGKPMRVGVSVFSEGSGGALVHQTDADGRFRIEVPPSFVGKVSVNVPTNPFASVGADNVRAGTEDLCLVVPTANPGAAGR
jgi:RNA polymerase sigma-70 factor (ECF subfamily)